jgi:hypothetical protein
VAIALGVGSVLLFMMALFVFLPMVIFVPGKFALSFTFASVLLIGCIAFLRGPRKTLTGLFAREKLIFSGSYIASLCESCRRAREDDWGKSRAWFLFPRRCLPMRASFLLNVPQY